MILLFPDDFTKMENDFKSFHHWVLFRPSNSVYSRGTPVASVLFVDNGVFRNPGLFGIGSNGIDTYEFTDFRTRKRIRDLTVEEINIYLINNPLT